MLSSIFNQVKFGLNEIPNIKVTAYVCNKDPFDNWNKRISTVFPLVNMVYLESDEFKFRSLTRDMTVSNSDADWIITCDADLIFENDFFSHLSMLCYDVIDYKFLYGTKRLTTTVDDGIRIVNGHHYNSIVNNPVEIVRNYPSFFQGVIGAGFFQLLNVEYCRSNGIKYYNETSFKDRNIFNTDEIWETRSEIGFRSQFKGVRVLPCRSIWHLNHLRRSIDSEYEECNKICQPM